MEKKALLFCKAAAVAAAIAVFGCQQQAPVSVSVADAAVTHRPKPPAHVPKHVQTAVYLWTPQLASGDPARFKPYVNWVYPLYSQADRVHDAGIKTIYYVNPAMPQRTQYEYDALTGRYAGVRARDCNGNDVITYAGKGLLADPRAPQAASYYADVINWYIHNKISRGGERNWDAFFIDNNGALYGASPTPCNYNPVLWGRAFDRAIAQVHEPIVTNSLSANDRDVATFVDRLKAPNIIGGMFEQCFNSNLWTAEELSQIQTVALFKRRHKRPGLGWWCYLNNTSAPGDASIQQRMFGYASFLLTYDPGYSTFQESFTTLPSTFQVFPETGFVPLSPVHRADDLNDLRARSGAYVRDYYWCYFRGKRIGACEVAVNPGSGSVDVPNPQHLKHSMVLEGGGVLDGGRVRFNGPAVRSLAPQSAAVLVP